MDMDAGRIDGFGGIEGTGGWLLTSEKLIASACESMPAKALLNTLHCSLGLGLSGSVQPECIRHALLDRNPFLDK
jgi:hypothetical protein